VKLEVLKKVRRDSNVSDGFISYSLCCKAP
jgi:hypothetical protein